MDSKIKMTLIDVPYLNKNVSIFSHIYPQDLSTAHITPIQDALN